MSNENELLKRVGKPKFQGDVYSIPRKVELCDTCGTEMSGDFCPKCDNEVCAELDGDMA